jgi:asparagine synthase (glutamine-hydrolysing)
LPPGTLLTWNGRGRPTPRPYWSAQAVAETGMAAPFQGSTADAIAELDALLRDAVKLRMVADVPLGAFLSGGIDSSTVVALMQVQSRQPVKTFTIGFDEASYNEAPYAQAIAQHLGTDHTELYVTPAAALAVIPQLPTLYDEPFADPSQLPTWLIAHLARQSVTVSLSGDGGDELFAGYSRYGTARRLWGTMGWLPPSWRRLAADHLMKLAAGRPPSRGRQRLSTWAEFFALPDAEALYRRLISHWKAVETVVIGGSSNSADRPQWLQLPDYTHAMMYCDTVSYLPDDILVKLDRASMGVSLEARVPLLDHRVVELAWRLPLSLKVRGDQGKWLLRQVLYKYVPRSLVDRPKMGFGVPFNHWLRGPLRDWAEALLDEHRLQQEGFFNPQPIRQKWLEHLSGDRDWQYYLWDVLMFQAWCDEQTKITKPPIAYSQR